MRNGKTPEALNEKEQRELLRKFRECGDVTARERLVETSMRLVYYIAKKYQGAVISADELAGAGSLGLLKAVGAYDLEKRTKFSTYAGRCIENEMLMELRRWTSWKKKESFYLEEPIGVDREGHEIFLCDVVPGESDTEGEALNNVSRFFISQSDMKDAGLKERDIKVICLRFGLLSGERRTQREIADRLGISRSYVSRIEKISLKKLRKKYEALEK